MRDKEFLRNEAAHYRSLADQLRQDYEGLDDETLKDTLEGVSDLPQMIQEIVRSSLDDEALIVGLKSRIDAMLARTTRLKERYERKRRLSCWAMGSAGIGKLDAEDFSVSLSAGPLRLELREDAKLPEQFLLPQPPKPDKAAISAALKRGDVIEGAGLVAGDPFITVRTR
jgi:hypothetical protein